MHIPALNEVGRQALGQKPKYPDNHEELNWIILYPGDYEGHGSDVEGNVALMVDIAQARELKRLAEVTIDRLSDEDDEPRD